MKNSIWISGVIVTNLVSSSLAYYLASSNGEISNRATQQQPTTSETAHERSSGLPPVVKTKPMLFNLRANKFLKLELVMEGADSQAVDQIGAEDHKIREIIAGAVSDSMPDELISSEGRSKLNDYLYQKFNEAFAPARIKRVYFTEFIVQ